MSKIILSDIIRNIEEASHGTASIKINRTIGLTTRFQAAEVLVKLEAEGQDPAIS